jgi:D-alanyl-D-alanine carboxypeptidase/D-alanyl-D-alanine-endopeptidase (penicillin-binding protein 4)
MSALLPPIVRPNAWWRAASALVRGCAWGLLPALLAACAGARPLPTDVHRSLARAGVPEHDVSVLVTPLPDGAGPVRPPRLAHRADAPMHPASVMKLVTTSAGLDLLGPGFTWTNRVYTTGPVTDGVLAGDLVLRGSGDPKLVVERLDALLRQVLDAGVREVRGDIVLDHQVFERPPHDPAAFDDEPLRPYNVAPDGLLVNFKALVLRWVPDPATGTARVLSEPPMAGVAVPTTVPLADGPCGDWRSRLQADFSRPDTVRFAGAYPAACGERGWSVAYVEPNAYAARVVEALWTGAGGRLHGRVRDGATPAGAALLLSAPSLPLADIVSDINKFSNNVMARQLFLTLSAGPDRPATLEASRAVVARWWAASFGNEPPPLLDNGSGLSRTESSSARALNALLQRAATGPRAAVFEASLALAGVDGTAARLPGADAAVTGNARLKTGSLRDVAAIAGYVTGRSGRRYSLVAVINHPNAAAARPALERLLSWAVRDE